LLDEVDFPPVRAGGNDHVVQHAHAIAAAPRHCIQMPRNRDVCDLPIRDALCELRELRRREAQARSGSFEDRTPAAQVVL